MTAAENPIILTFMNYSRPCRFNQLAEDFDVVVGLVGIEPTTSSMPWD